MLLATSRGVFALRTMLREGSTQPAVAPVCVYRPMYHRELCCSSRLTSFKMNGDRFVPRLPLPLTWRRGCGGVRSFVHTIHRLRVIRYFTERGSACVGRLGQDEEKRWRSREWKQEGGMGTKLGVTKHIVAEQPQPRSTVPAPISVTTKLWALFEFYGLLHVF